MARSLLVWGLAKTDWSQEKDALTESGCVGSIELQEEGNAAWCAVSFPSLAAADACAKVLEQRFGHLRVCVEPDWQAFGGGEGTPVADVNKLIEQLQGHSSLPQQDEAQQQQKAVCLAEGTAAVAAAIGRTEECTAAARADLIQLAEWLGCRGKPHALQRLKAVCLAREAPAILMAVQRAGGAPQLAAADPAAAICLGHGLMQAVGDPRRRWLPSEVRGRVERAFALLGSDEIQGVDADLRRGAPGSPQRACATIQLLHACFRAGYLKEVDAQQLESLGQLMAIKCVELLRTIDDALSEWAATAGRAAQQLTDSTQRNTELRETACELHETSVWLLLAAGSLLHCMLDEQLYSLPDERELLQALGQLARRVVACMQQEERAAAAGLWPLETTLPAAACVGRLHMTVTAVQSLLDADGHAAAGMPAVHAAVTRALHSSLDHLTAPRHLGLLLHLSLLAQFTVTDSRRKDTRNITTLMSQLARLQHLAASWLVNPPQEQPLGKQAKCPLTDVQLLPFAHQLTLLMDITAVQLAIFIKSVLVSPKCDPNCIFDSGAVDALAAALQVVPHANLRSLSGGLVQEDAGSCLAPGLFDATEALLAATQAANAAVAAGKAWAGDAIAALTRGALGSLRLAHAESAAQEMLTSATAGPTQLDLFKPHRTRHQAARILQTVARSLTPPVSRNLADQGLADSLLEVLPWEETTLEDPDDIACWLTTVLGISAICNILAAVLAADSPARAAVLRDGSWDAAVQRVRDLQPPPAVDSQWPQQRKVRLQKVTAVLVGSDAGSCMTADDSATADDADAAAAAERAMQELLAEEQPSGAPGRHSKAAAKRARKKLARQRAAAAGPDDDQHADSTGDSGATTSGSAQSSNVTCSSASAAGAAPHEAAEQAVAGSAHDGPDPPLQQSETTEAAAESDWWRCPLSGRVMRDPVLYGSGGHSFERDALEEWLAANPGVDPLSRQPLAPGAGSVLPNHALRNTIQQLQLA